MFLRKWVTQIPELPANNPVSVADEPERVRVPETVHWEAWPEIIRKLPESATGPLGDQVCSSAAPYKNMHAEVAMLNNVNALISSSNNLL